VRTVRSRLDREIRVVISDVVFRARVSAVS
jgi:hypothetical protein